MAAATAHPDPGPRGSAAPRSASRRAGWWSIAALCLLGCPADSDDDAGSNADDGPSTGAVDEGTLDETGPDASSDGNGGSSGGSRCGDGVIEGDEVCDGDNVGGMTCAEQPGFMGGAIACTSDCLALDVDGCEPIAEPVRIRFNEVVSVPIEDGPFAGALDAIEITNGGETAVDLAGYRVSDQLDVPADGSLTLDGPVLEPGEFLVVTQAERRGDGGYPFDIPQRGAILLTMLDGDGGVADSVELLGENATDAWCRVPDEIGVWQVCARSLGESNE